MPPRAALVVMVIHAALFLLLVAAALYLLACGVVGRRGRLLPHAALLCAIELAVLFWNHWICPLTPLAEHLGARSGSVADLFLPAWSMPYVFPAFGGVVVLAAALLALRLLTGRLPPRPPGPRRGA